MRVVTVVRTTHAGRLETALSGIADVMHCASRLDCDEALRRHPPHALVVDPALLRFDELGEFIRETLHRRVPIVFYLSLVPDDVAAVLPLLAEESAPILLADIDDSGHHIREVFARLPDRSVQTELFGRAAELLSQLPPVVAQALAVLLLDPEWSSTKELPGRVGISRRTIDRALQSANYAPLQKWAAISRITRAFERQARSAATDAALARIAGYTSVPAFQYTTRLLLGLKPPTQLGDLSRAEFIDRAVAALRGRRD